MVRDFPKINALELAGVTGLATAKVDKSPHQNDGTVRQPTSRDMIVRGGSLEITDGRYEIIECRP